MNVKALITGASGFIGKALAESMAKKHDVICLSRKNPGLEKTTHVRGDFASSEDLRQLDPHEIDVVIHLAAVTGGCLERDAVLVNCEGTRCLMRYLIDHGCRKFVMASSIALVGFQNPKFRPMRVPIPDDHPCLDRDGYGLSKQLMETITEYYVRQNEEIDVINLRLSSVCSDGAKPSGIRDHDEWCLGGITVMLLSDAVKLFTLAVEAEYQPGIRTMNACCSKIWATVPTAQLLRHWWGDDVDVSHYEQSGREYDSVYDVSTLTTELGFQATNTLEIL